MGFGMFMIKNKLITVVFFLILTLFAVYIVTNIQTPEEFRKPNESLPIGTVTLRIVCKTASDNYDMLDEALRKEECVPKNGIIFENNAIPLYSEDTVFDILLNTAKTYDLQLDFDKSPSIGTVYIKGINYLYEFSCGPLSGWLFCVNGEYQSKSASEVFLSDKDIVEWVYSLDMGRDVGNPYAGDHS